MITALRNLFRCHNCDHADAFVRKVRASVVSNADVVLVEMKDADTATMLAAKKTLEKIAPDIRWVFHSVGMKAKAFRKAKPAPATRKKRRA